MEKYTCTVCEKKYKIKNAFERHLEKCLNKTTVIQNISNFQFSDLSVEITKKLDMKEKKDNGIFFTPKSIIKPTIEMIYRFIKNSNCSNDLTSIDIKNILEPSCGSCEFILELDKIFKNTNIYGIEFNETIYDNVKNIKLQNNNINIIHSDFLKYNFDKSYPINIPTKFDLIIGNPPYFVIGKDTIDKSYLKYIDGRPNIYILFILKSLELLNENGILSFVLPCNFLNCQYYNKVRNLIYENFKILDISDFTDNDYLDTKQNTCVITIQKKILQKNNKYCLRDDNICLFNTEDTIKKIKKLYENSTTLDNLNFEVKVGNVVWNQNKNILTDDNSYTRLIYSGDIDDGNLILKKYIDEKKNYINKKGTTELLLIVNRGYGKGEYNFNYCLVDTDKEYLVENHLICIKYKGESIQRTQLKLLYEKIIQSFRDERTSQFINLYFENNAINTKELQCILPIYL